MLVIFPLSGRRSASLPTRRFVPFFIGFAAAVLISVVSPLTQAGWNPARDCGPRVVAFLAEWGEVAIPGPSWGFWVYIAGPLAGGAIEAGLFECRQGGDGRRFRLNSCTSFAFLVRRFLWMCGSGG